LLQRPAPCSFFSSFILSLPPSLFFISHLQSKREMEALMRAATPAQPCGLGGAVMAETRSMGGDAAMCSGRGKSSTGSD
jgi:hypothetical protein